MKKPVISVIIPTYNRSANIKKNLEAFEKIDGDFEIVVINDGSSDNTEKVVKNFIKNTNLTVKYIKQANKGAAAARNTGFKSAKGEYVLFMDDDMLPVQSDFLKEHLLTLSKEYACLGSIEWPPEIVKTEIMNFICPGPQFDFGTIKNPEDCGHTYFMTGNISLHRSWLAKELFDEQQPFGFEDVELGCRLGKQGLIIKYNPRAKLHHYHKYSTFDEFLAAMEKRNSSYQYYVNKHPELKKAVWRVLGGGVLAYANWLAYSVTGIKKFRNEYWRRRIGYAFLSRW
jgi:glycosyltransferase involved in cell wall biosynthesis